jgi:hypothetical protein
LRSVHNIQESSFCANSTARVNALRRRWWRIGPLPDLPAVIERFWRNPAAAEFAPVHIVGEAYVERSHGPETLELLPEILNAVTLNDIAQHICQRPVTEVARLNPGPDPDVPLLPGTEVNLPDPAFAPILAARFAAAALAQRNHLGQQTISLIRKLVPLATPNPTALDTVLARLLLAERDVPADLLAEAHKIAPAAWMVEPVPMAGVEA